LDNRSRLSLFGNPKMVTNIRESKMTLELATNAGTRTTKKIADVPGYLPGFNCKYFWTIQIEEESQSYI
jgi:hypothetical protein